MDGSLTKCDAEIVKRQSDIDELQKQLDELEANSKSVDSELKSLSVGENDEAIQEIEKYLAIYERLKGDEKLFKASCNDELERLQKELESLSSGNAFHVDDAIHKECTCIHFFD